LLILRSFIRSVVLFAMLSLLCFAAQSSEKQSPQNTPPPSVPAPAKPAIVHTPDTTDLARETQQTIREGDYAGLVWWIPYEYWTQVAASRSPSASRMAGRLQALKDYTVVGIFLARVSDLGAFNYVTPAELRQKVSIRDAAGKDYPPISQLGDDAKMLEAVLKPMLANAMGRAGENFELLFFPARTSSGNAIAPAAEKTRFSVVLKYPPDLPEVVYEWRLPLTSISPPKYCPVGKERVNANWDYCPWHGVPLNGPAEK